MEKFFAKHKNYWGDKALLLSSGAGFLFFFLSLVANKLATVYANEQASGSVRDIILNNVPVFNVDFIVNEGALIFLIFILLFLALEPKRIAFTLKAAAIFILIRSLFIMLTHLGPFPEHSFIEKGSLMSSFNLGSDFFFSGHAGLPFLMALVFWEDKIARYVSLFASFVFGAAVLLGHLHYSIDVFSAFFITYSIFRLAAKLFSKDYKLSREADNFL